MGQKEIHTRTPCFEHSHHALIFKGVFQHNRGIATVGRAMLNGGGGAVDGGLSLQD
jgi:hypothetical protein